MEAPVRPALPRLCVAVLVMALPVTDALAWGPTGHRAVGRIAERHLDAITARALRDLLGTEQLAYVTTWSDEIRSEPEWAKGEPWHREIGRESCTQRVDMPDVDQAA